MNCSQLRPVAYNSASTVFMSIFENLAQLMTELTVILMQLTYRCHSISQDNKLLASVVCFAEVV